MIKVKFNDNELSVKDGTRVLELVDEKDRKDLVVCKVGAQVKELNYALSEKNDGMTIELLNLNHAEAGKAYEASLRYIVAMAFYRVYPKVKIRFSYNISRSISCQALTKNFNMSRAVEAVFKEVQRIIDEDLPIQRVTVTIEEATEIYKKFHLDDKIEILKYRPEKTVHLYKCGEYYNYLHNYMVPSTGCIHNYTITPYSPGFIIQYPRHELDATIPEFEEEANYGKTLQKAYNWAEKAKIQTVNDINRKIDRGEILEFVQMCEARHNKQLAELGDLIENDIEDIRLVAIAGPSSSGKTTFCNRLRIELLSRGINPVTISMDDYYFEKDKICAIQGKPLEELDLEHVNCLDIELFNKDLFDLINGEEVTLPRFNFKTGKREAGKTIRLEPNVPIIIEGIHALNERLTKSIPKHQKFKIYIAPQAQLNIDNHSPLSITSVRLIRRIVRDMKFRNCPAATTIDMWQSVRNGEFRWIYPNQENADYVFNSSLGYELCVLKKHAMEALQKITANDVQYLVANRLIKNLKYFRQIDDENIIPCNSLLREFIGGSCFHV
ncbi:MAG: nucleoside kinase [Clostridiales bacterium]|nr:nucleoside kinase [Clostridiales bacterium]